MNASDQAYLATLRQRTAHTLRGVVGESRNVALVDAPNQRNVGDSLIWAGEMAYLAKIGARIKYVADMKSFDPAVLRRLMPSGVVLLHGGGNFGDLWMGHQHLREQVASHLPDYPIVQLPQSIHFRDRARASAANATLARHPDFQVLIRDSQSLEMSHEMLPDLRTSFCYDMALGWEAPLAAPADAQSVLVLARSDKEASSGLRGVTSQWLEDRAIEIADWYPRGLRSPLWKSARALSRVHHQYARARRRAIPRLPVGSPDRASARVNTWINELNIASASALFEHRDLVVTDRLHAHVLAALMGLTHVALDNSYRKVSTIFNDYTGAFSSAHYAANLSEARQLIMDLPKRES